MKATILGLLAFLLIASSGSLVNLTNNARGSQGLNSLIVDARLNHYAQQHSAEMANLNDLYHSDNLASAHPNWERIGENVGRGPSLMAIQEAFLDSPAHRANIMGDWTHIGTGVVEKNGRQYVTVIFMKAPVKKDSPPEPKVVPKPSPSPSSPAPIEHKPTKIELTSRPTWGIMCYTISNNRNLVC